MAGGISGETILDSIEIYSIELKHWKLVNCKLSNCLENLSLLSLEYEQFYIFGGSNPNLSEQFIYLVDLGKKTCEVVIKMNNMNSNKSILYCDKVLIFGVNICFF